MTVRSRMTMGALAGALAATMLLAQEQQGRSGPCGIGLRIAQAMASSFDFT